MSNTNTNTNLNCLNKCIDNSCNKCYDKENGCNRRYNRFENRHNKYEYVHSSSRLERLKYDTIMRTNIKNKNIIEARKGNCGKKQIMTGFKNGRYSGTKERFTGWMFNKYHPEVKKETYYTGNKNVEKTCVLNPYSDLNCKVKAQKEHCCKIYDTKDKKKNKK